jgi:hypothetical protein
LDIAKRIIQMQTIQNSNISALPASHLSINIIDRKGPLFSSKRFTDTKDPCPVFDGKLWHIYGTGGINFSPHQLAILHATSPSLYGPWTEEEPAILDQITSPHVAAPGVVKSEGEQLFHMFVQTDFLSVGGRVEHLTSLDGKYFKHLDTPLLSIPKSKEAGIYDPHPFENTKGEKYMVYAGSPSFTKIKTRYIGRPEIYLAKSKTNSWYGPWERRGVILDHSDVKDHHNQLDDPMYEWGLEGPQLLELPNGKILLQAVCFLPKEDWGKRQRVFFALADNMEAKFKTLGVALSPLDNDWESGETGHAAGVWVDNKLALFYQARCAQTPWKIGIAMMDLANLTSAQ